MDVVAAYGAGFGEHGGDVVALRYGATVSTRVVDVDGARVGGRAEGCRGGRG